MVTKEKYNYNYSAISIKRSVANRFRKLSKRVSKSHSDTLEAILNFFEWHGYTPHQRFGKDIIAGQEKNRKRIDAVIAIIKSVEKTQNIPLINIETMLNSLFEEGHKKYAPKLLEHEKIKPETSKPPKETTTVSRIKYDRVNTKLEDLQYRMKYLLDKIEPVKNRFGKDYLKIEITREEVARFKRGLKNS